MKRARLIFEALVMRLALSGRGPVGAGEWTDDRTAVVVTLDTA